MLFGPSVIIAGGSFIAVALLDRIADDFGITWLGVALKLAVPLAAMALAVYFLKTNALVRWLR